MLLELGIPRGLLVDWWYLLLGILRRSGKTLVFWGNQASALTISYRCVIGLHCCLLLKMEFKCGLLGRQWWGCILMIPSKIKRVRDRHVQFGLWTCAHEVSDSESLSCLTRGTRGSICSCLYRKNKKKHTAFYLFWMGISGCLESLEAYLSIFTHHKFFCFPLGICKIIEVILNISRMV